MRLAVKEAEINIGTDTFEIKDMLARSALGQRLTKLVDQVDSPTVIALDGAWGSGKSHFLKLWVGAHTHSFAGKAKLVYFDAFKEDFLDDPLVSLVAAITDPANGAIPPASITNKLQRFAIPLARGTIRAGLAIATAGISEKVGDVLDQVAAAASAEADAAISQLWQRETTKRAAMTEFANTLKEMTDPDGDGKPQNKLVIIVDELDRCRPDYALALLETIKHFFAVDGVHFVLGVNLKELENSVRARYGEKCDAKVYLQKFVTVRAVLPVAPHTAQAAGTALAYADKLIVSYELPLHLKKPLLGWLSDWHHNQELSLRDIDRVMQRVALVAPSLIEENIVGVNLTALALTIVDALRPEITDLFRRADGRAHSEFVSLFTSAIGMDRGRLALLTQLSVTNKLSESPTGFDSWSINAELPPTLLRDYIDNWSVAP